MKQAFDELKKVAHNIKNPDYHWIKDWEFPFNESFSAKLADIGIAEHYQIAKRLLKSTTHIFEKYDSSLHSFQSTDVERTSRSAGSFGHGLFEGKSVVSCHDPLYIFNEPYHNDTTLRFFTACEKYKQILDSPENLLESQLFHDRHISKISVKVYKKLGLEKFNENYIKHLYSLCIFDYNLFGNENKWCSLFDEEDAKIFEYVQDLLTYYQRGYGNDLNYKISCPLLYDFFESFDLALANKQSADLRFAHAETLIPFISLLGLFKDEKPIHSNMTIEEIEKRHWRISKISPFAANIIAFLYECNDPNRNEKYLIKFFHNEKEIKIPRCKDSLCGLNEIKKIFENDLKCDFSHTCKVEHMTKDSKQDWATIVLVSVIFLSIIVIIVSIIKLWKK